VPCHNLGCNLEHAGSTAAATMAQNVSMMAVAAAAAAWRQHGDCGSLAAALQRRQLGDPGSGSGT
jgi:hypothetical protein